MDLLREAWRQTGKARVTAQPLLVVHRIDKETSGLLVYAKNKPAERGLAAAFREHTARRSYLAVAHGDVRSQRIESKLLRDRGDGLRGNARHKNQGGKTAITHIETIELLGKGAATLCRVRLETGKTHQIRIHLSESGHPIAGERVYIRDFVRRGGQPLACARLLLHAETLGFVHPRTGKRILLTSPLPEDFEKQMEGLRKAGTGAISTRIARNQSLSPASGARARVRGKKAAFPLTLPSPPSWGRGLSCTWAGCRSSVFSGRAQHQRPQRRQRDAAFAQRAIQKCPRRKFTALRFARSVPNGGPLFESDEIGAQLRDRKLGPTQLELGLGFFLKGFVDRAPRRRGRSSTHVNPDIE